MLRYTLPTYYTAISLLLPRFILILMLTLSLPPRYFCVSFFSSRHVYSGILISFLVPLLLSSLCTLFSLYIALFLRLCLYLCLSVSSIVKLLPSRNLRYYSTLCCASHRYRSRALSIRKSYLTIRRIVTLLHPLALLLLY